MELMEGIETVYDPNAVVGERTLLEVSEHPGVKRVFPSFARHLGVHERTLAEIESIYLLPLNDKCHRVLQSWRHQKGSHATLGALMEVLEDMGFSDITEKYGKVPTSEERIYERAAYGPLTLGVHSGESRDQFIGREKEIKLVVDSWGNTRIFGVFGFSGIGKSRFASEAVIVIKKFCIPPDRRVHQYSTNLRGVKSEEDLKLRFLSGMGLEIAAVSYATEINSRIKKSRDMYIFIIDDAEDVDETTELRDEFLNICAEIMKGNENATMFITSKVKLSISNPNLMQINLPPLSPTEVERLLKVTSPEVYFGKWIGKIVTLCDGNAQLTKMAASAIRDDKGISIEDYVKILEEDRLKTMDDEAYSTDRRTEGMVNILMNRMPQDQKSSMEELNYMHNTFSCHAAAAILAEKSYGQAYVKVVRNLRRRSVLEEKNYDDEIRLFMHGMVKDWFDKESTLSGDHLKEIRRRFIVHFSDVIESISAMMQSAESGKAIRSLGHEILNLKKLLSDSAFVDDETYEALKNVALRNRELIEKYIPDLARFFFENMYAASSQKSDQYGAGVMASRMGAVYTNVNNEVSTGKEWYDKAEAELVKSGPCSELAMLYQHKGWNYYLQADKATALSYLEKAREMIVALGLAESRMAMMNFASMGVSYTFHGDLDKGKEFHEKSIQLCEKLMGRHYSLGSYYNNLGINYSLRGDMEQALVYTEIGLRIKRDFLVGPEKSVVLSLNNLAMLYSSARNDTDKALVLLGEAEEMMDQLPFSVLTKALTMDNYCQVHNKRRTFDQGIPYGEAAVQVNREHRPRHVILAESLINYSIALHGAGRHSDAYSILQEALGIKEHVLEQMPKRYYVFETYKMLTKVCKAMGLLDEATQYLSDAMEDLQRLQVLHEGSANDLEKINNKEAELRAEMQG